MKHIHFVPCQCRQRIVKRKTLLTFFVHEHDLRHLAGPSGWKKVKPGNVDAIET